ncbi:MAG: RnfABCDGE type electron transport complex subunit D [Candidatus Gorgyraea atricola]|nr:RnfABCDGE type electron transport complex subunit D [Candidatus Gorgyraea atricola]
MKLTSIKVQLSLFLGLFAAYIAFIEKDFLFLFAIFIAVLFSAATDTLINYLKNKKITVTESSIVTGLIIGYVLSSQGSWLIIALASIFAIVSKHVIRFRKVHIFNPAALGIFTVVLFFGAYTEWKTAYSWYILVPIGIYFASRIKRLSIIMSFFITSLFLHAPQAFLHNVSLLDIVAYLNYFFIFVMMIEPRTTPVRSSSQILFGIGVATFIFAFYQFGVLLEAELYALLGVNFLGALLRKKT